MHPLFTSLSRPTSALVARIAFCCALVGFGSTSSAAEAPQYGAQIAPILQKYCVGCHGGEEPEGRLSLETFAALQRGGEHGPVVVPKNVDGSKLIAVLTGRAEPAMPPEGNPPPTADEIALLRTWIEAGAAPPADDHPASPAFNPPQIAPRVPPRQPVLALAWSPDAKTIAAAGHAAIRLLDAEGRAVRAVLAPHVGNVNDLAYTHDGARLLAAAGEPGLFGELTAWDAASGSSQFAVRYHRDSLYAVAVTRDGALAATAGYDQQIQLWNLADGQPLRAISGHSGAVFDLEFSPDGRLLASASADRTIKLWDVASGQRLDTFGQPIKEQATLVFFPTGDRLAAAGADNRIRVWQISRTAQEGTNPIQISRLAHQGAILKLAISHDGASLASGAEDRSVKLWNAADLTQRWALEGQADFPAALAYSPDGKRLAVGRLDGSLDVVETEKGEIVPPPRPELASIEPRGVERGVASRLRLTGKFLTGASAIEPSDARLAARLLPSTDISGQSTDADGQSLEIEVTPAADLPRGPIELAVKTPGGVSGRVKLYVDDLPQLVEAEPNQHATPTPIAALPAAAWGRLEAKGDVDRFAFDAQAGQQLVFELATKSLGSKAAGALTLYDPQGRVVASDADDRDPLLAYAVPAEGRYTIEVHDLQLAGSAEHFYRLSLGALPYVTAVFPLSVPPRASTEVELIGHNLGPSARVSVTAGEAGDVTLPIDAARYRARGPLKVGIGAWPEHQEHEPNQAPAEATAVAAPATLGGRIAAPGDVDLARFTARAGETWIIETDAARRGSPIDTKLEVLDATGRPVERLLLEATRDAAITFRPINSIATDVRLTNWEEMELNQFVYFQGEVSRLFRLPQGPDSGFLLYAWNGQRIGYFDTSPTTHPVDEPCYIVEPRPAGSQPTSSGLPVFRLHYANDDDGGRRLGRDSRLTFTAPTDGDYLVRVGDARGFGGAEFAYRLTIRRPQPDFQVTLTGANAAVFAGGGRNLTFTVDRVDGFEGEVKIEAAGLPPGFSISTPIVVESGHTQASAVLVADAEAPRPTPENENLTKLTATALVGGAPVSKEIGPLGPVKLAAKGKITVRLEPAELTIAPGQTITATLKIERNGQDGPVNFSANNLPHGVYVDNIGLNGVLIPEGQTERQIFLTARPWVPETSRSWFAVSTVGGGEASPPNMLHVRKPSIVAQAGGAP